MYRNLAKWVVAGAVLAVTAVTAFATPDPTSVTIKERLFNDCPGSILTTTNNYPSLIAFDDQGLSCVGFANRHNWRFSEDGTTDAVFDNDAHFSYAADLVISGTGEGEAGFELGQWWGHDDGGVFNVRTTDGEIACFAGRLPFFSFTGTFGLHYVKGEVIGLEIIYTPNDLNAANPATIEYKVNYGGAFTSGPIPFDEGNPAEDPPHGLWGMLNDFRVGGRCQLFMDSANPGEGVRVEWRDVEYINLGGGPTPTIESTWGSVKARFNK